MRFFNDTATTEIYPLSLHDALPISFCGPTISSRVIPSIDQNSTGLPLDRSEEHTSELQSLRHPVCRLLLAKQIRNSCSRHSPPPSELCPPSGPILGRI